MVGSAVVAVPVLVVPAAVVDGAVVVGGAVVEAVDAGVELLNRLVEAGAVVVFAPPNRLGAAEEDGGALVVAAGNRDDGAGPDAGVGVVVVAEEAVGKREPGFEVDAAVLAGVEPPIPENSPPAAGAVVPVVPEAAGVAGLDPNKLPALPEPGVDSAGLEAPAPPLKRPGDGALGVPPLNKPPVAGFGAVVEAPPNRLGPEVDAEVVGCVDGVLENSVLAPPNKPPAGFGSAAWVVGGAPCPNDSFGGSAAGVVEPSVLLENRGFAGVACPVGVDENRELAPVVPGAGGVELAPGALPVLAFKKPEPPAPNRLPPVPGVELLPAAAVAGLPNSPPAGVPEGVPVEAPNRGFDPPNRPPAAPV